MVRFRAILMFSLGLIFFTLTSSSLLAFGTEERVEVPISQVRLSDGEIRYSVPVAVGGSKPITAMLDTGSFGLRVMASALSSVQYEQTGTWRNYPFASGAELRGTVAKAVVSVGGATTS